MATVTDCFNSIRMVRTNRLRLLTFLLVGVAALSANAQPVPPPGEPVPIPTTTQTVPAPTPEQELRSLAEQTRRVEAQAAADDAKFKRWVQAGVIAASILILVIMFAVMLWQMSTLRDKLASVALKDGDEGVESRKMFFQLPLGVPDGTVRSAIAVLIVVGALLTLIAAMGEGLGFRVPEALTGVFGTILGFYFGRSGSLETQQAASAVKDVARVADGLVTAQQAVADERQALQNTQSGNFAELSKKSDLVLAAADAVLAGRPPGSNIPTQALVAGSNAIGAAKAKNTLADLTAAFTDFVAKGPIALIVNPTLPALAPFTSLGLSTLQAARALASISPKLSPEVARLWVARVSQLPFRAGLISPTIDDDFANRMIAKVPAKLLSQVAQAPKAQPAPTATDLVRMALQEDGASVISDQCGVAIDAANALVTSIVAGAIDEQLATQLPAEVVKPFGDASNLLTTLTAVQSSSAGLEALDILLKIAREARDRGIDPRDLLPA